MADEAQNARMRNSCRSSSGRTVCSACQTKAAISTRPAAIDSSDRVPVIEPALPASARP